VSTHAAFAAGLLQPAQPAPAGWRGRDARDRSYRYAVHRNTATHALVGAFESAYPVMRALLGAECFGRVARDCARAHPPRTPVLAEYVSVLPDFIAGTSLVADVPYLGEIAWLEAACLRVYHAADVAPLSTTAWQVLHADPQRLAGASLQLHPACAWRACTHAAADLWLAHMRAERPELAQLDAIDSARAQDVLVWRDRDGRVQVAALPPGSASAFTALAAGSGLLQALATAPADACAAVLARLAESELVVALRPAATLEALR
jgi:hypothetical protein